MAGRPIDGDELLTPSEVAALFRVDPKTVTRWAKAGKLTSIRTLGGHRRYRATEVYALLDRTTGVRTDPTELPTDRPARPAAARPAAARPQVPRQPQVPGRGPARTINLSTISRDPSHR